MYNEAEESKNKRARRFLKDKAMSLPTKKAVFLLVSLVLAFLAIYLFYFKAREEIKSTTPTTITFQTVDRGSFSNVAIKETELIVIREEGKWQVFWKAHKGSDPQTSVPRADFSKEMVVGVFSKGASSGYEVVIYKVDWKTDKILVLANIKTPGDNCSVTKVNSQPFHLVKMPKTSLPVEVNTTEVKGQPCSA